MSSPDVPSRESPESQASAPHGPAGDASPVLHARRPARRRCWRQRGGCLEGRAAVGGGRDGRGAGSRSLRGDGSACRRSAGWRGRPRPAVVDAGVLCGSRPRHRRHGRRCRGGPHLRCRARVRRAGQRDRQAGVLHLPVRRHRQPLAAGRRHLDRGRGADLRPGHPLAHRGPAAHGLQALGCRRQALARRRQEGSTLGLPERRRFWERFTALALAAPDRRPTAEDRKTLLAEAGKDGPGPVRRRVMSRWSVRDRAIRSC